MWINIVMVIAGFFFLIRGADYFVSGAASIARRLGIPSLVIGLTIVAIGTSAPELFVNIIAATQGATDLSVANVLGSNFVNILLGLGIAALFAPLALKSGTVYKEIPFSLLAAAMVLVLGSDALLDGLVINEIGRSDGISLLALFLIFIVYTLGVKEKGEQPEEKVEQHSVWKSSFMVLGGVFALAMGGSIAVDGSIGIAEAIGISQNLIGLTVVAIGTSLPEIVTSVIAVRKGHVDMVVGGIVGSSVFNVLFVLGVTATIAPLPFSTANITDALAVMVATIILFGTLFIGRRRTIDHWQGVLFIGVYIAYMIFAILRG